jgi:hypothetical protein
MTSCIFRYLVNDLPTPGDFIFLPAYATNWKLWPSIPNHNNLNEARHLLEKTPFALHHSVFHLYHNRLTSIMTSFICALVVRVEGRDIQIAYSNILATAKSIQSNGLNCFIIDNIIQDLSNNDSRKPTTLIYKTICLDKNERVITLNPTLVKQSWGIRDLFLGYLTEFDEDDIILPKLRLKNQFDNEQEFLNSRRLFYDCFNRFQKKEYSDAWAKNFYLIQIKSRKTHNYLNHLNFLKEVSFQFDLTRNFCFLEWSLLVSENGKDHDSA